jgi:hypothetical protein
VFGRRSKREGKVKALSALKLVFCACVPIACLCGGTGGGNPLGAGPNDPVQEGTYTAIGDQLSLDFGETIYTDSYCYGDSLVVEADTFQSTPVALDYELSGNTLALTEEESNEYYDEALDDYVTFQDPNAIVAFQMVFTRSTSGTDIQGTWVLTGAAYEVVSGTLTAAETQALNTQVLAMQEDLAEWGMTLVFGASTVSVYQTGGSSSLADELLYEYEQYVVQSCNITAAKVNSNTISLTGDVTGEVVTIAVSTDWDMTYSSSDPTHATHTYYDNPTSCPNDYEPLWFEDFLVANCGGLPKRRPLRPDHEPAEIEGIMGLLRGSGSM